MSPARRSRVGHEPPLAEPRSGLPWVLIVVLGIVAVVVLGAVAGFVAVLIPRGPTEAQKIEDMNSLRQLANLAIVNGLDDRTPLAPDGRLDVYAVLKRENRPMADRVEMCTSQRSGKGPSAAEIEAGDYRRFPWHRYKGKVDHRDVVFLLWERAATDGQRLVARSDGSVSSRPESEVQAFLRTHPGQE